MSRREGGFTSFVRFGSEFEARALDELKSIPHAVLPDSSGYDGQFYAQLALTPLLTNPQLPTALDNARYRSRRMLFSWTAWLLGVGQPRWVIQAFGLQNVLFWLATAALLLYWLPPTRWFHFVQWAAILFSRGWLDSIGSALLDGPALFLMLLAIWYSERGRPVCASALLGLSLLGKETNLLGGLLAIQDLPRSGRSLKDLVLRGLLLTLPMLLWLGVVYSRFGYGQSTGNRNFAFPFFCWIGKVEEIKLLVARHGWTYLDVVTGLCVISTLVQIAFFATSRQWSSIWWRVGAPYAILGVCLGNAVLEGLPGAFVRVLLPLTAAFNLSLKRTRTGWMLLAIGNLSLLPDFGFQVFTRFLALLR